MTNRSIEHRFAEPAQPLTTPMEISAAGPTIAEIQNNMDVARQFLDQADI